MPKDFIAFKQRLRKKRHWIKGTAGPKRRRLLAELEKDTKKKESNSQFLEIEGSGSGPSLAGQSSLQPLPKSLPSDVVILEVTMPS